MRLCITILAFSCALALVGCGPNRNEKIAQAAVARYYDGDFAAAAAQLRPLADKTDGDFVLNNLRLGSVELAAHDLLSAEAAFLRAYEVINSVGVNDGGRTAGAILVRENVRVWKGEPFERAMANHYLGLVYYLRGDYANARAAYENALFKLRDYGDDKSARDNYREVESEFALGSLMLGKCWLHLGRPELAQANFDRAQELQPELAPIIAAAGRSNVLLLVDFGYGPRKVDNFDGSIAGFAPKPELAGAIPPLTVRIGGKIVATYSAPTDTLAMAQQRRWQSIDTIRVIKDVAGYGLMAAGAYRTIARDDPVAGLALAGAGLLLQKSSKADLRHWDTLPRTTYVVPLQLPPGTHDLTIDFPIPGLAQTWRGIVAPTEGEAAYYMRIMRWRSGPYEWAPPQRPVHVGGSIMIGSH
jgi:tetratricopeptide (TPR) repeat protein